MKHYILLWADRPAPNSFESEIFFDLSKRMSEHVQPNKGMKQLGANVWLIPRSEGMHFVTEFVNAANHRHFVPNMIYLDEDETPPSKPSSK